MSDSAVAMTVIRPARIALVAGLLTFPATLWADEAAQPDPYPKVLRYEEDYRYLADPTKRSDFWDPIKFIPLTASKESYLTIGGEWRERYENFDPPAFGLTGIDHDGFVLHRLLLSGDLHLGEEFRTFVQLGSHFESGRKGLPVSTDDDDLDLQQGFLETKFDLTEVTSAGLRAGRQEIVLGSGRLVTIREGTNVRRSFDGARAMLRSAGYNVDALWAETVELEEGLFDDEPNSDEALWGLYGVLPAPGIESAHLDLYYLGLEREPAFYAAGTADERRHSVGARFWGDAGSFDYNLEALYQFGEFGGREIGAWAASSDIGFTFTDVSWQPRIGLKANAESGDDDLTDDRLGTFNPLFPNHAYFTEAALAAPMNGIDVHPNLTLHPTDELTLRVGWDFFWREDTDDGIYSAALTPIAGTAGGDDRYIGNLVIVHGQWRPDRHLELNAEYTHFEVGGTVKQAGGRDVDYVMFSAAYKF